MLLPYIKDEALSSLHNELKQGNIYNACYFAKCVKEYFNASKIKQYLLYYCLEDTNNISLYNKLIDFSLINDKDITDKDIYNAVYSFAMSRKKWENNEGRDVCERYLNQAGLIKEDLKNKNERFKNENILTFGRWGSILRQYDGYCNKKDDSLKEIELYSIPDLFAIIEDKIKDRDLDALSYLAVLFYEFRESLPSIALEYFCENKFSVMLYKAINSISADSINVYTYITLFYSFVADIEIEEAVQGTYEELSNIELLIHQDIVRKHRCMIKLTS